VIACASSAEWPCDGCRPRRPCRAPSGPAAWLQEPWARGEAQTSTGPSGNAVPRSPPCAGTVASAWAPRTTARATPGLTPSRASGAGDPPKMCATGRRGAVAGPIVPAARRGVPRSGDSPGGSGKRRPPSGPFSSGDPAAGVRVPRSARPPGAATATGDEGNRRGKSRLKGGDQPHMPLERASAISDICITAADQPDRQTRAQSRATQRGACRGGLLQIPTAWGWPQPGATQRGVCRAPETRPAGADGEPLRGPFPRGIPPRASGSRAPPDRRGRRRPAMGTVGGEEAARRAARRKRARGCCCFRAS
jgi:hypothetical protein